MPPDSVALPRSDGTLFIGVAMRPADLWRNSRTRSGSDALSVHEVLVRHADTPLHNAATVWGVQSFGRLRRPERDLVDQILRLVEIGRLQAQFLPLFRDDPRGPREEGALRIYQLGSGPLQCAPAPTPTPTPIPAPSPVLSAPPPSAEKDVPNEPDQAATLKKAAEDGTPFCEICEAIKAARAAALA